MTRATTTAAAATVITKSLSISFPVNLADGSATPSGIVRAPSGRDLRLPSRRCPTNVPERRLLQPPGRLPDGREQLVLRRERGLDDDDDAAEPVHIRVPDARRPGLPPRRRQASDGRQTERQLPQSLRQAVRPQRSRLLRGRRPRRSGLLLSSHHCRYGSHVAR